jgi:glucose 1-dehydrogenase
VTSRSSLSVPEKGIAQAFEIQRRLRVWQPKRAAVLGAGTIGLLATLILRLRGVEVTTFGKAPAPYLNANLLAEIGARYISTDDEPLREAGARYGPFDLIYEATGYSPLVFEAMEVLGKNGVLVLASVTGGSKTVQVPADKINLDFVLGNKVMVGTVNGNRDVFEAAVRDLAMAEAQYPGWVAKLLTHRVVGLERYAELFDTLLHGQGVIKAYLDIAPDTDDMPAPTPAGARMASGSATANGAATMAGAGHGRR